MLVANWGTSLAVRLPSSVVEAMELKEGDDIAIEVATSTGNKVICAHDYPAWGILPDRPNTLVEAGGDTVQDTRTGLLWQQTATTTAQTQAAAIAT